MILKNLNINNTLTLFLDRDGVINKRIIDDYVKKWEDFEFLPGVLDAFKIFAKNFDRIIIVSNQQGIGKKLMTENDVNIIHQKMIDKIIENGGRIDKVYFCSSPAEENDICRKPNIGMALKAARDFPDIDFNNSIMVGDAKTDMEFGRNLNMINVFLSDDDVLTNDVKHLFDYHFKNLYEFSLTFLKK